MQADKPGSVPDESGPYHLSGQAIADLIYRSTRPDDPDNSGR